MGIDFVPVADESYDLLMTKEFFESEQGRKLITIIQSDDFKARCRNDWRLCVDRSSGADLF